MQALIASPEEQVLPDESLVAAAVEPPSAATGSSPANGIFPQNNQYAVRLEFFNGPMDLLLHLVARQELPIEKVSMTVVAEQYLQVVMHDAHRLDLEQAGEFLVIAATLLAIKSRSLLPNQAVQEEEHLGEWDENNPFFANLKERLKAYQLTQAQAKELRRLPQLGFHTFTRRDPGALQPTAEMLAEPEEVHRLAKLFGGLLKRIGAGNALRIKLSPITVVSSMVKVIDILSASRGIAGAGNFRGVVAKLLLQNAPNFLRLSNKRAQREILLSNVISGFIAVLELVRRGMLSVNQEGVSHQDVVAAKDGQEIELELRIGAESDLNDQLLTSEFDQEVTEEERKIANS